MAINTKAVLDKEKIILSSLEEVLHSSMMPYAEYVILDRALPRVEDGLKPVQRRILYSMYEQGMYPDRGYKKSARVVGDCLAKYHPHGDSSVYDAMVRLAQTYNLRMTLVDGQGNFGSVDGDPPAAMRYTEVKLQPLALELLRDIDKDTVTWKPNFDDSLKEPDILPSRYPNLLVNGATGIAVGLATNIPTHNLGEVIDGAVQYIRNPKISLEEMMKIVRGPDFPTGGFLIGGEELKKAYKTGRGKIYIRAKLFIDESDKEKKSIIITELPFQVNKAVLLKKIDDLREEKKELFQGIQSVNDESDRTGMRAVIKLKKDVNVEKMLANLYKYTNLQVSFGINMVVIAEGKPMQLGLIDILKYYTDYQRNVVLRRTKFDLDKAKERAHILEGLIIAANNIDEVVKIIKGSSDTANARKNLKAAFKLSDKQANAILDLRLARLTKLEINNLKLELKSLKEKIKEYEAIIASKQKQNEVVISEMLEIKKRFRDERRTVIVGDETDISVTKTVEETTVENFIVGVTVQGKLRKIKPSQLKRIEEEPKRAVKEIFTTHIQATSDKNLYCFTNLGNCYKVDMEVLPEAKGTLSQGVGLNELFVNVIKSEIPVAIFAIKGVEVPQGKLLFYTAQGMVKQTEWSEYTVLKSQYQAIKLKDGDELIKVEVDTDDTTIFFVTEKGMSLNAVKDKIPDQGRVAGGVKGIDLYEGDKVIFAGQLKDEEYQMLLGATSGNFKKVECSSVGKLARARKGVKIFDLGDGKIAEAVIMAYPLKKGDSAGILVLDRMGMEFYSDDKNLAPESRVTKGRPIKNIGMCQPEKATAFYLKNK